MIISYPNLKVQLLMIISQLKMSFCFQCKYAHATKIQQLFKLPCWALWNCILQKNLKIPELWRIKCKYPSSYFTQLFLHSTAPIRKQYCDIWWWFSICGGGFASMLNIQMHLLRISQISLINFHVNASLWSSAIYFIVHFTALYSYMLITTLLRK